METRNLLCISSRRLVASNFPNNDSPVKATAHQPFFLICPLVTVVCNPHDARQETSSLRPRLVAFQQRNGLPSHDLYSSHNAIVAVDPQTGAVRAPHNLRHRVKRLWRWCRGRGDLWLHPRDLIAPVPLLLGSWGRWW